MNEMKSTSSRFYCSCKMQIGTCKNLDHPKTMEWIVGPFKEGWALGKYGAGVLKYGKLVQDYKYNAEHVSSKDASKLRSDVMKEVMRSVNYFIDGYFPPGMREFDSVLPLPCSRQQVDT